eukprot:scaffold127734_cov24-Phaeocystis_antarctica.AAC.1
MLHGGSPPRVAVAGFPAYHGMPVPSPPGPVFLAPLGKDNPRNGMMSREVGAPTSAAPASGAQAGLGEAALQHAGFQRAAQPSALRLPGLPSKQQELRLVLNEDGELVPDLPSEPSDLASLPSPFELKGGTMQFDAAAAAAAVAAATTATATDAAEMDLGELEADLDASFKDNKHTWTLDQDASLLQLVNEHGARNWSSIADKIPGKVGKQCRE